MTRIAPEIFKAYDIRGVVDRTLTAEAVELVGRALGSLAREQGGGAIIVGRDGRLSGPKLAGALAAGIRASGVDAIDIGMVTTPMAYFAAFHLGGGSTVAVTGSHNPPDYNGLKMVIGGTTLFAETIQALRERIEAGRFASGSGALRTADVRAAYLDRIVGDVKLARPMKIVVDCGNGVAGAIAPELYRRLGCTVDELYCEVDGTFPNHHPDPSQPENLRDVIARLAATDAELGLAFDGDGDRLGVVTKDGRIIYADRQLMLFAQDVLSRVPGGEIIYDVKCTRNLAPWVRAHGGKPVLWKTGHSLIKAKMKELHAEIAGEMSGHMFFADGYYGYDDAIYASLRLMKLVADSGKALSELAATVPSYFSTPEIRVDCPDELKFQVVKSLQDYFRKEYDVIVIDGVRAVFSDGWGLVRASNTQPVLVLRFEAKTQERLNAIRDIFYTQLKRFPEVALPTA